MTPETARTLAAAVAELGSPDDARALVAARLAARLIAAEGIPPNTFTAALFVTLTNVARPAAVRPLAELGPRAARKRMVAIGRQKGLTAEDKARVAEMRNRLAGWARDDFTAEEIAWLDGLWCAATPATARASEPG